MDKIFIHFFLPKRWNKTWIKTFGVYTVKMGEIEMQDKIRIKKIDEKDDLKKNNCK
jgi:hypothetical protein